MFNMLNMRTNREKIRDLENIKYQDTMLLRQARSSLQRLSNASIPTKDMKLEARQLIAKIDRRVYGR